MIITDFIENYKNARVQNSKVNPNAVSEYLTRELGIKTYIPFEAKRKIAEMIVKQYTNEVDGIKKHDSISAYVGFVSAMIAAHTTLEFNSNPIEDYDLLAGNGLLPKIIAEFQESYNECEVILKMALAMELENNNVNGLIGRFLNKISGMLDGVVEAVKDKFGDFDLQSVLGADFKEEDLTQLKSFLDRMK